MMAVVPVFLFSDKCHCKNLALCLGWPESPAADLASPGADILMLTQQESPAPASAAVSGTSPKLHQLLRKRLRQLLLVVVVLAACVAVAATALAIWWLNSLNGLPDIGDPFDVAAFREFRLPDEQNAFTYLRRASEKLTPIMGMVGGNGADPVELKFSWSTANPTLREWAGENREAFELFQQGAEQADAANPAGDPKDNRFINGGLIMLAFLEASRREESGDTAGAWDCHRAVLRTISHLRRRGSTLQRRQARDASHVLQRRLTDWATGPRTTISQLRRALEVVLENEPKPEWDLLAVKCGYLELMGTLERPIPLTALQDVEGEWTFRLGDMSLSPEMVGQLEAARRFLLREPERSRRVLRLLCANYLAQVETRRHQQQKPAVFAALPVLTSTNPVTKGKFRIPLYPVGPEAPAGARALPPQGVAGWLVGTLDARMRLLMGYDEWLPPVRSLHTRTVADRKAYRDLVIMLATEIYRRERGAPPPTEDALVGTYLQGLPDDGSAELSDGTTPTVE
jgi:hypothetical protein